MRMMILKIVGDGQKGSSNWRHGKSAEHTITSISIDRQDQQAVVLLTTRFLDGV